MKRPPQFALWTSILLLASCGDERFISADLPQPSETSTDDHGHTHDEVSIGSASVNGITIELAQGGGALAPGKEGHLLVKLSEHNGTATVRAWIGTPNRLASVVSRGSYDESHGNYNVHAMAPDPMPFECQWWIEIEKPDGSKGVVPGKPIL
jgi:hypothetical protein